MYTVCLKVSIAIVHFTHQKNMQILGFLNPNSIHDFDVVHMP